MGKKLVTDRIVRTKTVDLPDWADIVHVLRAVSMLKPNGRLVAIVANGSRQKEKLFPVCWDWKDLPANTFKSEGTGVRCAVVVIEKGDGKGGGMSWSKVIVVCVLLALLALNFL